MKFNEAGENEAQVLIEVHDFIVSAQPEIKQQIKDMLHSRFDFGKWEDGAAEYAGRKVQCQGDRISRSTSSSRSSRSSLPSIGVPKRMPL